jgi:two-component sensor histidine kinase
MDNVLAESASASAEVKLERNEQLLKAINHALSIFVSEHDSFSLFSELLSDFLTLTGSEYGFIGEVLFTEDQQPYIKTHAISHLVWAEETRAIYHEQLAKGMACSDLSTLYGEVLVSGETVISNDPKIDPVRCGLPESHSPLQAFMGLPVYGAGELLGVVGLAGRSSGFDNSVRDYLKPLSSACGNFLRAYRADKKKQKAENELRNYKNQLEELIEDRTEQIEASLREKDILLKELYHRVKNNMQVMIGLLSLQANDIEDEYYAQLFIENANRIQSMSAAHEYLYQSDNLSDIDMHDYFERLVDTIKHGFGDLEVAVKLDVSNVQFEIEEAITCGLIVNELLTNAFKYAFPEKKGNIEIMMSEAEDSKMKLVLKDNGIGLPVTARIEDAQGLGVNLVYKLVSRKLKGRLQIDNSEGSEFIITFRCGGDK